MKNLDRDLLVLLKSEFMNDQAIEREVNYLNKILLYTESPAQFCNAHELVLRNRITSNPKKILNACQQTELKAFYFLINKN